MNTISVSIVISVILLIARGKNFNEMHHNYEFTILLNSLFSQSGLPHIALQFHN